MGVMMMIRWGPARLWGAVERRLWRPISLWLWPRPILEFALVLRSYDSEGNMLSEHVYEKCLWCGALENQRVCTRCGAARYSEEARTQEGS